MDDSAIEITNGKPLRVLHVVPGLPVGGAELTLLRLAHSLTARGIESTVVSLTSVGEVGPMLRQRGVEVVPLGLGGALSLPGGILRLRRLIRRLSPQVVQTWLYAADLLGTLASSALTPAIAWNIRSSDMSLGNDRTTSLIPVLAKLSRRPNIVIANSLAGKAYHQSRGYRPRSWHVVPNGVDTDLFAPSTEARSKIRTELGIEETALVIGVVGRDDRIKNHDGALRVAAAVCDRYQEAHFVFAGRGLDSTNVKIGELARRLGLGGRYHLLGERKDIASVYCAMDALLSTSLSEGLPNCIAEAMATALPIVATDVGDTRHLVDQAGIIFGPNDDAAAIAACFELINKGADGRRTLGDSARKRIMEEYSTDAETSSFEAIYRGLSEQINLPA